MTDTRSIRAVVFDFDGTLTEPGLLDFAQIRREMECPAGMPTLEYIESLEDGDKRVQAERILHSHEMRAAAEARPTIGARALLDELHARRVPCGILTRNSRAALKTSFAVIGGIDASEFVAVVTRDDGLPLKPDPGAVLWLADRMGAAPDETVVIGDYVDDITAGSRAGALTLYLRHGRAVCPDADECVEDLPAAFRLLLPMLPLRMGKLPNELLSGLFDELRRLDGERQPGGDATLALGPGVGEDAALIGAQGLLAVCSDPVTLSSVLRERYAVILNANDLAVLGIRPRWFVATCLLPPGTTGQEARSMIRRLAEECRLRGILLAGGHSEVTDAVSRTVISGTMLGDLPEDMDAPLVKQNIRDGDLILIVGAAGLEGSGILAAEATAELTSAGIDAGILRRAAGFTDEIEILSVAEVLRGIPGIRAMHDVTEGGVLTAVGEMGEAASLGVEIDLGCVPVRPETEALCRVLGLDPLGLLGSGALLVAMEAGRNSGSAAGNITGMLNEAGIKGKEVALLGRFRSQVQGVRGLRDGLPVDLPRFEVDELARFFACRGA